MAVSLVRRVAHRGYFRWRCVKHETGGRMIPSKNRWPMSPLNDWLMDDPSFFS